MLYNSEKIRLAYKTIHNFKGENQVILLMIIDGKRLHYFTVKSLSALLSDRLLLLELFSLIQHKIITQKHEKVCKDHDYCYVEMPDKGNKILKPIHRENSMRVHLSLMLT